MERAVEVMLANVEALIGAMDLVDGDPDLEADGEGEPDADGERSLGWIAWPAGPWDAASPADLED